MSHSLLRLRSIAGVLLVLAALALGTGILTAATPLDNFRHDDDRLVVATAHWRDRTQLQRIVSQFQHVAVDERRRTARVEASATDLAMLRQFGVRVEIDGEATARMRNSEAAMARRANMVRRHLSSDGTMTAEGLEAAQVTAQEGIPGYSCYRTAEETYATMDLLAGSNPQLASVVDIGPAWTWAKTEGDQGYRMRVLRLGNKVTDAMVPDKPSMVVVAALHAREYTTAELATRFAEWLVDGYGRDHEATWLLDNFRFHLVLQSNPDGRKRAESGLAWRKNVNTDNGSCSSNAYGVDLNRNFSWRFGSVSGGSSGSPCVSTYRGPGAESEPEVQDIVKYVAGTRGADGSYSGGVLADRRSEGGAAPSDYRGLLLDIHSYAQLVLWPWAHTSDAAPNSTQLQTLGRRMAYFNGYRPAQWTALYAADGTITDTIYGHTGAPSYTIELGQEFFEDCATFESSTYPRNLGMLRYSARNLQAPLAWPAGPDTTAMGASAAWVAPGDPFAVSAWLDDSRFNQTNGIEPVQAIASASATLDATPWAATAVPLQMRPSDGAFDSSREQVVVEIDTRGLAYGRHVVYVQGTDASGRAGTPGAVYFTVRPQMPDHDYDGDLSADVFWRNIQDGSNVIWLGADRNIFQAVSQVSNLDWQVVGSGDFNGDGASDLFWRNKQNGMNTIWLSGNSATPQSVEAVGLLDWKIAGIGDFDGDATSDVLWRNSVDGRNVVWLAADRGASRNLTQVSNMDWRILDVGDFNGDGNSDILWHNRVDGGNTIWLSGDSTTPQDVANAGSLEWQIAETGDFNGDGAMDLIWRHRVDGRNSIWLSADVSRSQFVSTVNPEWQLTVTGDYDGDGNYDLFWRNTVDGRNTIWLSADAAMGIELAAVTNPDWKVLR